MSNAPTHDWTAYRSEFPVFERTTYLNTCSLGARSRRTCASAVAAVYAARSGMDMILEIGVDAIRKRELVADLIERIRETGLAAKMPANLHQHGGIVMVPTPDPAAVVGALAEQNSIVDHRPGFVRVSPFFYNTTDENQLITEQVRQLING